MRIRLHIYLLFKRLIFIAFLLLIASNLFSAINVNENCKNALKLVYELKFFEAENLLLQEKTENKYPFYIINSIKFLKVLLNEQDIDYENYKKDFSNTIQLFESENFNSPECFSIISEMNFRMAIIKFKMGDKVSGAINFYKSYRVLIQGIAKYKNNENLLKLFAFFKILFGAVPDDYLWIADLIGIKGDINSGSNFINLKHKYYIKENSAKSIEYTVLKVITNDIFAEENSNNINIDDLNLENSLIRISYLVSLIHHGKSELASEIVNKYTQSNNDYYIIYFEYLKGLINLYRLDIDANIYLEKFVNTFEGKNFFKTAYQKLSWYYLIFYNKEKFEKNSAFIKEKGIAQFDADIQAISEINHYNFNNIDLLKARLLFDGGYYEKSEAILKNNLNNKNLLNVQDEIFYRLARIAQKNKKNNDAIEYYNQIIAKYNNQTNYFCAVAFMNLGALYEEDAKYKLAEENYLHCLKSKNKQYKNSIEHKAKAGLNRIKSKY